MYQPWLNEGVKLTVAKEFRCEYSQMQPTFTIFNTVMGWATFKTIFGLREMEKVLIAWQNKGWTKVTTAEDWKKVKGQVVKQSSPKENGGFSCRLEIEIEERQDRW